jgi:proteasomal ATPase-associated factor 1
MYSEGFNGVERLATGAKQACGSPTANVDEESKTLAGESVTDTQDKVVYAALSSGSFGAYDLSSKRPIFGAIPHLPSVDSKFPASLRGGPIHALAHDGEHLLASGSSKGIIVVRDTRMLSSAGDQALAVFRRNEAAINDLAWVSSSGSTQADLAIATASGLPCRVGLDSSKQDGNVKIVEEYAGWEPVPIETVAIASDGGVWFAGGEGGIRRY